MQGGFPNFLCKPISFSFDVLFIKEKSDLFLIQYPVVCSTQICNKESSSREGNLLDVKIWMIIWTSLYEQFHCTPWQRKKCFCNGWIQVGSSWKQSCVIKNVLNYHVVLICVQIQELEKICMKLVVVWS